MKVIFNDTIATIETSETGKAILTFYSHKKPVFSKEYNSFRSASIAQGKLMKKYYNGGFEK